MLRAVTPQELQGSRSRKIVDVRGESERAGSFIPGSTCTPMDTLERECSAWPKDQPIALVCRSGRRACSAASLLANRGFADVAVLEGGIEAWRAAGLPLDSAAGATWSLDRQIRTATGSLTLVSLLLGLAVSPGFFAITFAVGAGLTLSGITDSCLLGKLLARMPWNRNAASS